MPDLTVEAVAVDEGGLLRRLQRQREPKSPFVFTFERGAPFTTVGFARMVERAGSDAYPVRAAVMIDPLTNQARRFSRHEQSGSMPNASSRALTIRTFCLAFDGRVIAKEPQHFLGRIRPSRIGVGAGGTSTRPSVASSMDAPLL